MRTFVFTDDKSNKFWNIDLRATAFTVTFGKVGTKGQTQVKDFPDEATAQQGLRQARRREARQGLRRDDGRRHHARLAAPAVARGRRWPRTPTTSRRTRPTPTTSWSRATRVASSSRRNWRWKTRAGRRRNARPLRKRERRTARPARPDVARRPRAVPRRQAVRPGQAARLRVRPRLARHGPPAARPRCRPRVPGEGHRRRASCVASRWSTTCDSTRSTSTRSSRR